MGLAIATLALSGWFNDSIAAETRGLNIYNTVGGASEGKTVWSGVYTPEQAKNGKAAYGAACSSCHLENLAGDTMSPALIGEEFRSSWDSQKLRALYSRIISTMPADNPGTISEKTVLDIVAYLLEANGFPTGTAALERADDLNSILFLKQQ